jgi:hypothetical protein
MSQFVTINNIILDKEKVACLILDEQGKQEIIVYLDTGEHLKFTGAEAALIWKEFDKNGYLTDN